MADQTTRFSRQPDDILSLSEGAKIWRWNSLLCQRAETTAGTLHRELPWQQPKLRLFGQWRTIPRLQSWHGDPEAEYRYSGLTLPPAPWHPLLNQIKEALEDLTGTTFNSVLANLYRDGDDAMGWHADDEPELGAEPWIASYSLGASRRFSFRPRDGGAERVRMDLLNDQVLLMSPEVQHRWQHSLPRTRRCQSWRINLTFRQIYPST